MKGKIYLIAALLMFIILPMDGILAGSLQSSVTFSFNGVVQLPSEEYSYIISKSGSNYIMKNGITGQIEYQSTNPVQVFTNTFGRLPQGGNILTKAGTYNLPQTITATGINNIKLYFEDGATLFVSNGMNAPAIRLNSVNNWLIKNPTIDGNSANQAHIPGQGGDEYHGIMVRGGSNNLIDGATITRCGVSGIYFLSNINEPANSNGVVNSKISYIGWNGVTVWDYSGTQYSQGCYAINNDVSHCGDVGIAAYAQTVRFENNYVHDMDGTLGDPIGGGISPGWGIAIEGGGRATVKNNTIERCGLQAEGVGIELTQGSDVCTVTDNTIRDSILGIGAYSNGNNIEHNTVSNCRDKEVIVTNSNNNTLKNNNIYGKIYVGISSDIKFFNNVIDALSYYGLELFNSARTTVQGNIFSGANGINIGSGSTNTQITNQNNFSQCIGTKINNYGTGTTISGNIGYP